jgi:aryl-alcohol dehydrogenase-like predicted oxidoreductase
MARRMNPIFLPEALERAQPLIDALRDIAASHQSTPAQVALAWVISHGSVVAIPGASSVEQLESNAAAAELTLSTSEISQLTAAAEQFEAPSRLTAVVRSVTEAVRERYSRTVS